MASNDVLSAILHYKKNIDKISDPPERALKYEDRLLHCINRLYKLPVNVNHLQETGIGKTVNALRKIEGEKGLGDAAKALVAKWKTMVMLEDEAERKQREGPPPGPTEEDIKKIKLIREAEKSQAKKTDSSSKSPSKHHNENYKSKSHEESKKHKSESSDVGKERKRKYEYEEERHHSKHSRKDGSNDDESDNIEENTSHEKYSPAYVPSVSSSKTSSKSNEKYSHKELKSSSTHGTSKHDKRKDHKHKSSNSSGSSSSKNIGSHNSSSNSSHSSHDKSDKKSKSAADADNNDDEDGGINSQSGASFADALGPMVVKKSKKKSSQLVTNSSGQSSTTSESSPTKERKQSSKQIDINRPPTELEPLEPDLMATLPVPTPYYKPNPIYNLPPQEASRRRIQAEEDALNTIMSNKNQRTKVYSGVKGGLTYVPTLYEICCRVLQQHLDAIEYTGGIPYSLLKPVLDGATPAQLFQFEHYNPYIIEDTDHLWKFHVNKEFRSEKRQEFESWREMYLRCIDEREEKYKAVTANIQKSIEKSAPVRKAKLAYIDVAKPPRNILRKQIKNGTSKPEAARLLGKDNPEAVRVAPPKQPSSKEPPSIKIKPKVAPLMQKTLKSIKMTRFKR